MLSLTPARWKQVDRILAEALDRPVDERSAFLRSTCGQDRELYDQVSALLASEAESERALGEFATGYAAPLLDAAPVPGTGRTEEPAPESVGPYRIVRELGRGGMGTVYLAERADGTFSRTVALKLVRRGMDTDEVLRRFDAERRILAVLDHPNVARILDAGVAADGRPFFAMEHVEGEPITSYCDSRRLSIEARLRLFDAVCDAVHHAHRHLVVHRDLKPSNVLVAGAEGGAEPIVKLLDFGIARVLEGGADAELTGAGRVLTPAYASPEQLGGAPVATASDVYQLGLLLHELLVGVRRQDRARPSALVTAESAAARRTTPERLRARLRGDLDVIIEHSLEEEPERRYPSVAALAGDLARHLRALPVMARPQSRAYRAGRFVRRHRLAVALTTLLVALTLASAVALGVSGRAAARERDRARDERDRAQATAALLEDLFAAADPLADERLDTLRARDLLARGVRRANSDLTDQPLVRAAVLQAIGQAYIRLGLHEPAVPTLTRALSLRRAAGAPSADVAESEHALGQALLIRGRHAEAEHYLRRALADREGIGAAGRLAAANTRAALAEVLQAVGRNEEAETLLRASLGARRAALGDASTVVADNQAAIAGVLLEQGRLEEAEGAYREAIDAYRRHPVSPPGMFRALGGLGFLYVMQGRHAEAEAPLRESLALIEGRLGAQHWRMGLELTTLASSLRPQGKLDEAEQVLRRALTITPRRPQDRAITLGSLATVLRERGDLAGAEGAQREAVAILERAYGPADPVTAASRAKLASILRELGRGVEAERLQRGAPPSPAGHSAQPAG